MLPISAEFPVSGITVYNGVVKVRRTVSGTGGGSVKPKRGKVTYLSRRSLNNLAFLVTVNSEWLLSMITLTYPIHYPITGKRVKSDLSAFLSILKTRHKGIRYIWFMEFQKRGAPHIHLLLDQSKPSRPDVRYMAEAWCNIVAPLDWSYCLIDTKEEKWLREACEDFNYNPKFWANQVKPNGLAHYAVSYACKPSQKKPPDWFSLVGRFWGSSRDFKIGKGVDFPCDDSSLVSILGNMGRDMTGWNYVPKIVFIDKNVTNFIMDKFA